MKEFIITIMLITAAIWPAISQSAPGAPPNITVGEQTILAVYPEMAEFVINVPKSQLTIVRFDKNDRQSTYQVILTQTEPHLYRADFCGSSWLEVNTINGSTTLCHLGVLEAFFPASYVHR